MCYIKKISKVVAVDNTATYRECTVFYTSHLIFKNGINFSFVTKVRSAKLNYDNIKLAVGI